MAKKTEVRSNDLSENTIRSILEGIGEDSTREGLIDTPKRVLKSYKELFSGYNQKPEDVLKRSFSCSKYDEMIILRDVPFHSMCEHHMLLFSGTCNLGYIPGKCGRVVGISKLSRLVDVFARRLQIQERMTMQIGESLVKYLKPRGAAVIVSAVHSCMTARGVQKSGSSMVTSFTYGNFRKSTATREEFLRLIKI